MGDINYNLMLGFCSFSACILCYIGFICYKRIQENHMKVKNFKNKNKIIPICNEEFKDEKEDEVRKTEIVVKI
jgi:hypothetical protein